jgi:cell division protein ZapE
MAEGPLAEYRSLLAEGSLRSDSAQAKAVSRLQSLHLAVESHVHRLSGENASWLGRIGLGGRASPPELQWTPLSADPSMVRQGLYLFGDVGTGKSMLMDLFFATSTVPQKRRVHFHAFMRDVHASIHRWRQEKAAKDSDPIPPLAKAIATESWLLCFDELQVNDIGDAMILGRLFAALLQEGVVMVITSNRPPEDLYKDGLQRERFLPFIALIREHLDVLEVNGGTDYRLGRSRGLDVYYTPLSDAADEALAECFDRLAGGNAAEEETMEVQGRRWTVPRAADGVAWLTFEQLCQTNLGAADYLALASRYRAVILEDVPRLSPENRDAAKRFVTLIDALYEAKVIFVCSAESPPESLYTGGSGAFEFHRTVSRLMEMQSQDYITRERRD